MAFPILAYTGPYKHEWTNAWHKVGAAYQFVAKPMVGGVRGWIEFAWDYPSTGFRTGQRTLHSRDSNWGAFHLAGLVQIDADIEADNVEVRKACGLVSVNQNNLRMFRCVGNRSGGLRQSLWAKYEEEHSAYLERLGTEPHRQLRQLVTNDMWYAHDVYCIPCTGKGPINLILVTKNHGHIEVYFLRGRDIGEENRDTRSQLPGMHQFYYKMRVARFFARLKNMWTGVCCD